MKTCMFIKTEESLKTGLHWCVCMRRVISDLFPSQNTITNVTELTS